MGICPYSSSNDVYTVEKYNFRNNPKCHYNDSGFCKFRDECREQHFSIVCAIPNCDRGCKGRHPKTCKNQDRCRFFLRDICAYKHVDVAHDEGQLTNLKKQIESLKTDNERKESEINVIKKELEYLKNRLENETNEFKEESKDLKEHVSSLKILNDDLLKENDYLTKVNIELKQKLNSKISKSNTNLDCTDAGNDVEDDKGFDKLPSDYSTNES